MLLSIIVPVYNVEKYLDECLQSIIQQTEISEKFCEILLINDGSTDHSGEICDKYKKKYPKMIRVFHNLNQGLLLTRRFGYAHANGEYIINCDSDDRLEPEAIKKIKKIITEYHEPDVIYFNLYTFKRLKIQEYKNLLSLEKCKRVSKENIIKSFFKEFTIVSLCSKCYKKKCVDVHRDYSQYAHISNGEDCLQTLEIIDRAKTFVYYNEALYGYRMDTGMTRKFDAEFYSSFSKITEEILNRKKLWNIKEFDELLANKILSVTGRAVVQSRYNRWNNIKEHKKYLQDIYYNYIFQRSITKLSDVKCELQKNYIVLLTLLRHRSFYIIILMLYIKNLDDKILSKLGRTDEDKNY